MGWDWKWKRRKNTFGKPFRKHYGIDGVIKP